MWIERRGLQGATPRFAGGIENRLFTCACGLFEPPL